ncbi:hypothetical protein LWI28_000395 [Acer negundo]|uniref:Uncharacterized protein n=1 Tax=Acer negundo TaxID=4023 RepID=A0AAD5NTD8_ACENE|nr:hypothetical protein LWI28_000395 [Acer negundo]
MDGVGPEDYDVLFGLWLKAGSPMKKSQFRQKREDQHNSVDKRGPEGASGSPQVFQLNGGEEIGLVRRNLEMELERGDLIPQFSAKMTNENGLSKQQYRKGILHDEKLEASRTFSRAGTFFATKLPNNMIEA